MFILTRILYNSFKKKCEQSTSGFPSLKVTAKNRRGPHTRARSAKLMNDLSVRMLRYEKKKSKNLMENDDWLGSTYGQASSDGASQQKCPVPLLQG